MTGHIPSSQQIPSGTTQKTAIRTVLAFLATGLAVAVGGAVGAILRWAVTTAWPGNVHGIIWSVLVINMVGSAILGVLTEVASHQLKRHPTVVAFLGTGMMGGFTTLSTVIMDSLTLMENGAPWMGVLQIILNMLLGIGSAAVAILCTSRAYKSHASESK